MATCSKQEVLLLLHTCTTSDAFWTEFANNTKVKLRGKRH